MAAVGLDTIWGGAALGCFDLGMQNATILVRRECCIWGGTYPHFVSAMLRLSEDPLQLVANVMLMTLAPEEVGAMNVASLIFTIGMIIKTFYTLPDVLHAMYELSDGE